MFAFYERYFNSLCLSEYGKADVLYVCAETLFLDFTHIIHKLSLYFQLLCSDNYGIIWIEQQSHYGWCQCIVSNISLSSRIKLQWKRYIKCCCCKAPVLSKHRHSLLCSFWDSFSCHGCPTIWLGSYVINPSNLSSPWSGISLHFSFDYHQDYTLWMSFPVAEHGLFLLL